MLDAKLIFSDAQAETTAAAHDSTNIIDTEIANSNLGEGSQLKLYVKVNTTFTSGGSATMIVALQSSADNSTYVSEAISRTWAVADMTAGTDLLCINIPREHRRYLKLVYTIGTAAMTAGAIDAWIGI